MGTGCATAKRSHVRASLDVPGLLPSLRNRPLELAGRQGCRGRRFAIVQTTSAAAWTVAVVLLVFGLIAHCGVTAGLPVATADAHVAVAAHGATHLSPVAHAHVGNPVDAQACHAPDGITADRFVLAKPRIAHPVIVLGFKASHVSGKQLAAMRRGPPRPLHSSARSGRDLLHHLCVNRR